MTPTTPTTPTSERVDRLLHDQRRARRPGRGGVLQRARAGRRIGGVAAGIAAFVGADTRLVRGLWLVSLPLSLGITLFGYLLLWLLLPQE